MFEVTLSAVSGRDVSFDFTTVPGTATATDFGGASGTVNIPAGLTFATIAIRVNADGLSEDDETFSLLFSNPTNVVLDRTTATGTILNDDAPFIAATAPSFRAIALDNLLLTTEPFALNNPNYLGDDKRTRINIFSLNLVLTPGLVITAQGVDSQQVVHQLPVELVGSVPGFPMSPNGPTMTQIVLKLPDGITTAGDLRVRISARGKLSGEVLIAVKP